MGHSEGDRVFDLYRPTFSAKKARKADICGTLGRRRIYLFTCRKPSLDEACLFAD